ncbi:MAG: hypothetical protein N3A69_09320, partial [Leptospiraceae bacterium]|nr:hypothetical protein [Leptospiraceae bacterium]
LRESGGNTFVYSNVLNNGNNTFVHIFNSPDDLSRINLIEFQIILENVVTSNSMLIAAYSSSFSVMENYIVYGPLYRQGNNIFYVGVPVIEKNYYDNLTDDEKEKLYENILYTIKRKVYEEDRRLFNTLPHIRFVRTVGRVHNLNYTKENYSVKGIVKSVTEAQQFSGLEIGDLLLITDPIDDADPWHPHAGKIARYIENVGGQRVFNIFSVSQGTTARIFGEEELYVLVDTRWVRFRDLLPLKIEVEVFVENPDIIGLEEKYRKSIIDYLNEKGPDNSFKFSEIISLLHKVEGTKMVRFIAPKYDLIYDFDYKTTLQKLNKMQFITFVPEKIYTNEERLKVIIRDFQNA